ncbi:MAG TPA: EamA family transporter RarD [Rhizomicrobium sp.]|jgi:chloramphenicol-sensitive protein RarD|nr:EamA family transporter RarD [Rhizomicrobium sp.]
MSGRSAADDPSGLACAVLAYGLWGIMPLYWRLLDGVPPFELTLHRIVWCALLVMAVALLRGRRAELVSILGAPRLIGTLALTGLLISINWTVYIYCVASRQLVEASLGYYINPLISIALGVLFFGERMSRLRLAAIVLATLAVAVKAVSLGHFPWIAPVLALSFGFYGCFRKLAPVDALDGLLIEMGIVLPVAVALLAYWDMTGTAAFPSADWSRDALLIGAGPITAVPLALFAAAARRIRLSTLGFLQYLSPSITLLLAIVGFGEPFKRFDALAFGCVWAALVLVALEGRIALLRQRATQAVN